MVLATKSGLHGSPAIFPWFADSKGTLNKLRFAVSRVVSIPKWIETADRLRDFRMDSESRLRGSLRKKTEEYLLDVLSFAIFDSLGRQIFSRRHLGRKRNSATLVFIAFAEHHREFSDGREIFARDAVEPDSSVLLSHRIFLTHRLYTPSESQRPGARFTCPICSSWRSQSFIPF